MYQKSSVWLDASSWDRNLPNFTLDMVSNRFVISTTYVCTGIIAHVLAFVCLHFPPSDTRVLNSLEKLYITWVAAVNSFARGLNPQEGSVYIIIHRDTVSLYHIFSVWLDTPDASSWDRNLPNDTQDMVTYIYIYIYIYILKILKAIIIIIIIIIIISRW